MNKISQLKRENRKAVYTSGGFDILHYGHVKYLQLAKKHGDVLFVGIENDQSMVNTRGQGRPFNNSSYRMGVLAELTSVDFVFELPQIVKNYETDNDIFAKRLLELKPDVFVATGWDSNILDKQSNCKQIGISLVLVEGNIQDKKGQKLSSTTLAQALQQLSVEESNQDV